MPARQPAGAGATKTLAAYVSGIEAAGYGCVCGAFDDGSAVGEQGHLVGVGPEFQDEIVVSHRAVGFKAGAYFGEIQGAMAFVNLD